MLLSAGALAALLSSLAAVAPAPIGPSAVLAARGAEVRGATIYTVQPEERTVTVSALITVKNVTPDSSIARQVFTAYGLGIHREAIEITATHSGVALKVTSKPGQTVGGEPYTDLRVEFGRQLFFGQTYAFRLGYKLPDAGARSEGDVRVGGAFTGFYAYAYGEEEADVQIVLPSGFDVVTRQGGPLAESAAADGSVVLQAADIAAPASWWAYVGAERLAALRTDSFELLIDGERHPVLVRSWPEDRRWARVVSDRLTRGLPLMGRLIGLPWPIEGRLDIIEVYSPLLGGYAGIYYESTDEIRITEAPDELIVLHEASHAWFNSDLVSGRWLNEGLADEYASRVLARLGGRTYGPEPVRRSDPVAFPLDDWPDASAVEGADAEAIEAYGYNASWRVVRQLVDEIGEERMRDVFQAARERQIAYLGEGPPERLEAALAKPDWRIFLDLLEQRAGARRADELFETWVLGPGQVGLLRQRETARDDYAELIEDGRGWAAPLTVRRAMASWDFSLAAETMEDARTLLAQRDRVERLANAVGVEPSDALEGAYESADVDLAAAGELAADEINTLLGIDEAAARLAAERDLFTNVGLFQETPAAVLDEARRQMETDDLEGARATATRAVELLEGAPARGTQRVLVAVLVVGVIVLLLIGFGIWLGRRRRNSLATLRATLPRQEEPPSA